MRIIKPANPLDLVSRTNLKSPALKQNSIGIQLPIPARHRFDSRMTKQLERYQNEVNTLLAKHRKRELTLIKGVDFTSNDYLALSGSSTVRQAVIDALNRGVPLGSGGSRLLRGNHAAHAELEHNAAKLFKCEKTLYFANGYSANFALLTTLPKRHDLIVFDALSHASIREGVAASVAKSVKFAHNDVEAAERVLRKWQQNRKQGAIAWLVVESIYSMDGDCAPLENFLQVAQHFDAMLLVDEAHATGIWGEQGHGLTEKFASHPQLIAVHTCGKALGAAGALVCAPATLIDYMIDKSRSFIYSTAPPPINAISVNAALNLLTTEPWRREQLRGMVTTANRTLENKFGIKGSGTQIIPFLLGEDRVAVLVAQQLQAAGFDVRAIRPPTVPEGTARLRISITLNVDMSDITNFFQTLGQVMHSSMHCQT